MYKQMCKVVIVAVVAGVLSGCAATQLAITKRNLTVDTKTSATVFLDPVPNRDKTVYVQLRNTSGAPSFSIRNSLVAQLREKGYRVTHDLPQAHYLLQANILKVSELSSTAARKVMGSSFGSAVSGAALGVTVGALAGADGGSIVGMGLIGGAAASLVDNMVKDVNYVAVADVQISERTAQAVSQYRHSRLKQGTSTVTTQRSNDASHWKRYRTRVVSRAEKVNLHYSQARGPLERSIGSAIAGIF